MRRISVLALDGSIAAGSLWLAMMLRFEGAVPGRYLSVFPQFILLLVCCRVLASVSFRLHRWSFLFAGLSDGARLVTASVLGSGLFVLLLYMMNLPLNPPRAVIALEFFISTALMGLARFSPRLAGMYLADRSRATEGARTLIVGAGAAGEMLLRDLRRSGEHGYLVVGFIDDDPDKAGIVFGGRTVLGPVSRLREIIQQHRVDSVLLAIPSMPGKRIRQILTACADLKVKFKILPFSYLYLEKRVTSSMLQNLSPEDLLPRAQIKFDESSEGGLVSGRTALVTGAAGSIGREICRQLLKAGLTKLVMVDMNENELYLQQRTFDQEMPGCTVITEVANIREEKRMESLFEQHQPQDVFHAAAHKHVPLMEIAPCEAVKNNILGTRALCRASRKAGVERFVLISTDKAVRPTSVMGASKRVAEMVMRAELGRTSTRDCAVRFGNVLGSAGSVVPLFSQQIERGGPVTVTHTEVRRYFMTIDEAVGLVLTAAYRDFGELCVLDMGEQIPILDLARHMITMTGQIPDVDIQIEFTGLRPGEKLFEELLTEEEESVHQVHEKIFAAQSPPPPEDLSERLEELKNFAFSEDTRGVRRCLEDLVPSYHRPRELDPAGN